MTPSERQKKYRASNREKVNAYRRQHYAENRAKFLAKQKAYQQAHSEENAQRAREWREAKLVKSMLSQAKRRAAKNGLEFTLIEQDIILNERCPYLNIPLKVNTKGFHCDSYSLDRIDNTKGYVPGNVEVISNLANSMKRNATKEQLLQFAKSILERNNVLHRPEHQ